MSRAIYARLVRAIRIGDRRHAERIIERIGRVRPDAAGWVVLGGQPGDPAVLLVGPPAGPPAAVVRLTGTAAGRAGLERVESALTALQDRLAPAVAGIVPRTIATGSLPDRHWLAETALAGRSARDLIGDPDGRHAILAATTEAIAVIHAATARPMAVDDRLLERWIGARVGRIATAIGRSDDDAARALQRLAAATSADLRGRTLHVGWIHGDLWPANVLVQGVPPVVAGIVDWDSASDDELALHDRVHLALTTRRLVERRALGPLLADLLRGAAAWGDDDRIVLGLPQVPSSTPGSVAADGFSGLPERTGLWLYWLRFVESNLLRHPGLATDRSWLAANVDRVLACA